MSGGGHADLDNSGDSSQRDTEADGEQNEAQEDQSERLLKQMRRCVLVHHQLSCLLIHRAALRAGLYDANGGASSGNGAPNVGSAALERSIQSLGGSTARLFSMALRDQHDLEAMGETLQQRVDEMIQSMNDEFELTEDCGSLTISNLLDGPDSEVDTSALLGGNTQPLRELHSELSASKEYLNVEAAAMSTEVSMPTEAELLEQECRELEAELSKQKENNCALQLELDEMNHASCEFARSHTTLRFDEVERATKRKEELEIVLEQLITHSHTIDLEKVHAYVNEMRWKLYYKSDTKSTCRQESGDRLVQSRTRNQSPPVAVNEEERPQSGNRPVQSSVVTVENGHHGVIGNSYAPSTDTRPPPQPVTRLPSHERRPSRQAAAAGNRGGTAPATGGRSTTEARPASASGQIVSPRRQVSGVDDKHRLPSSEYADRRRIRNPDVPADLVGVRRINENSTTMSFASQPASVMTRMVAPVEARGRAGVATAPAATAAAAAAPSQGSNCVFASPESLAQLDVQLRTSQCEFWGM